MAERRARHAVGPARLGHALACGGAAALVCLGAAGPLARAAEPPRAAPATAAGSARPAALPRVARAPAADAEVAAELELLEFLGSDDYEPELQQYLASRPPITAAGRSERK